jgi:hypothetical protein
MKTKIFCFSKPVEHSTVASNRIAHFLARTTEIDLCWDSGIAAQPLDLLFIVNGAYAFCNCLPAIGKAVEQARRVVWVQNDYTIVPPKSVSKAGSPFRAAFVHRATKKLAPVDYWTTVGKNAALTPNSAYINWNSLTYEPIPIKIDPIKRGVLFYYGAFRKGREKAFDRYFTNPPVATMVSSTSNKFFNKYPNLYTVEGIERERFYPFLAEFGAGLYLEDEKSHVEFHSPANRFYEMLSAGLPILFQPEAEAMMLKAGIDIKESILYSPEAARDMLRYRDDMARVQRERWGRDYRTELRTSVADEFAKLTGGL